MLSNLYFDDDTQVAEAAQQTLGELLFVSVDEVQCPTTRTLGAGRRSVRRWCRR